ncbi:MAG TPA: ankyrin repeat domain-containing protein [Hyphomonadaceae bacterium]|jgi:hypothetical protein|nr:ankyrin repeat domain-containing protein [Hyphomonadaceae bacterium]
MRIISRFALAACVAVSPCVSLPVSAQVDPAIKPFRPFLSLNEDPAACGPFLEAWTKVFDAQARLDEANVDLVAAFPNAKVTVFPPEGRGFYQSAHEMRIDFDGDGENEVLHFDSNDYSWRYTGPSIWLFESESDFQRALQSERHKAEFGLRLSWRKDEHILGASYRELIDLGPIGKASIVQIGKRIYVNTLASPPYEDKPGATSLVHLNAKGEARTVCVVDILPPRASIGAFRDSSQLFAGLSDVYGDSAGACTGSMGWTAPPKDSALVAVLHRPWAMKSELFWMDLPKDPRETRRDDALRELRYMGWAGSDPQSWRDYLDVKQGRPKFLADMTAYYQTGFGKSEAEAAQWAEQAWRTMLDRIMYGDQPLAIVLRDMAPDLRINSDTPPEEIARIVAEAIQKLPIKAGNHEWGEDPAWDEAVQAAIHTRQPIPQVRKLIAAREKAIEQPGPNGLSRYDMERRQKALSSFLIAALGHAGLTYLVLDEAHADLSASTNDFGKTALMYAVQMDRLNAVQLLLSRKADVNAATQAEENQCVRLDRDHRTVLMYAAENGSPPVIDAILAAGADISAKDTQDHTAAWYFGRNAKVTDSAVRARLAKALGG